MKAYWQGSVSCDFFTMSIKLYAAVTPHEPRFHYLHAQCHTPLEYVRHCPRCGTTASREDIIRGYEYQNELVVVTEQELAALAEPEDRVIILRQCVHTGTIDPVSFDRAFYVEPGPGAKKFYSLLVETLGRANMMVLGVAPFRERAVVLRPAQGVLVLHTLFAPTKLLSPERLALPHRPPQPMEITAAQEWVTRLSSAYVPEQWSDQSHARLSALLRRTARTNANQVPVPPLRTRRKPPRRSSKAAA